MKRKSIETFNVIVRSHVGNYIEFSYNSGKGHFKVRADALFTDFNLADFKKFVGILKLSDDGNTIAGFINSKIRTVFNECNAVIDSTKNDELKTDMETYSKRMVKYHDILDKCFKIEPLIKEVKPVESNENITELKKCNVNRYIPTQLKPIWQNGKLETKIGYSFEYRGLPLQVFRIDGWETANSTSCRIFIIDPVIGLPVTQYDGMLSELESKISEVFFKYLETIESNAETIVQIANAFKKLKSA